MRRLWPLLVLLLTLAAGLAGSATSAPSSPEPGEYFLPDLRTLDPYEFHLASSGDDILLLLSNTIWNAGDGPLELHPENDTSVDPPVTHAFQLLYTEDEQGNLVQTGDEHPAGTFAFHPTHDHWHFQDLARYTLVEMKEDGSLGKTLRTSDKISFCMFDQYQVDPTVEHATADPFYSGFSCDENANVGYSVSWGDEYGYNFPEQDIVITGIEPGRYWVVSKADPEDLLLETNDHNNGAKTPIKLTDEGVFVITNTTGSICSPCGRTDIPDGKRFSFQGITDPSPGPRPSVPDPSVELSFKRRGAEDWRSFGDAKSSRPFTLTAEGEGTIARDGSWNREFEAHKRGTWVLKAAFTGNDDFTASSVKVTVHVD